MISPLLFPPLLAIAESTMKTSEGSRNEKEVDCRILKYENPFLNRTYEKEHLNEPHMYYT